MPPALSWDIQQNIQSSFAINIGVVKALIKCLKRIQNVLTKGRGLDSKRYWKKIKK